MHGTVDAARRRDHVQQHSGQHVLSAAFIRLFKMPTVSFHMGEESCTIDLETAGLSAAQAQKAELLANEVIAEDRPVSIDLCHWKKHGNSVFASFPRNRLATFG